MTSVVDDNNGVTSCKSDIRAWINAVFGHDGAQGRVHVAFGVGPHLSQNGKIRFRVWLEGSAAWPGASDEVLRLLLNFSEQFDAYLCPYVLSGRKRTKGASVARVVVHCDGDDGLDLDKACTLPGVFVVGSGTPAHGHVYVKLTRSVPPHQHEALCKGLAAYLGANDPKFSDNDVLRPPGTYNFKPTVDGKPPTPVVWLVRPSDVRADPEELAALLCVELTDEPPPKVKQAKADKTGGAVGSMLSDEVKPFDLLRYPRVRRALAQITDPRDRSKDTMRVVAACVDAGLTEGNARWAVARREDLAQRVADERHDDDVARCWQKAQDSREGGERRGIFHRRGW